jgi:hypothetical protein
VFDRLILFMQMFACVLSIKSEGESECEGNASKPGEKLRVHGVGASASLDSRDDIGRELERNGIGEEEEGGQRHGENRFKTAPFPPFNSRAHHAQRSPSPTSPGEDEKPSFEDEQEEVEAGKRLGEREEEGPDAGSIAREEDNGRLSEDRHRADKERKIEEMRETLVNGERLAKFSRFIGMYKGNKRKRRAVG